MSPGQISWPSLRKKSQPRHGYSSHRISMKLAGLLCPISTYKTYVSELLSWWPRVRSISWPRHYKSTGKCENLPVSRKLTETNHFFRIMDTHPICDDRGSREGHLRSHKVTIRFSPITRDIMEIETRKWCETTCLVKTLRKICISTYFGHNLSWPDMIWSDLWSNFEIDLSRWKLHFFNRQTQWCHYHFHTSHIKNAINEKPSPWKTIIFRLMTSGANIVDHRSNLIENHYLGMKRALQCFLFFLAKYFWRK